MDAEHRTAPLEIGILGTGAMAEALGTRWAHAGHRLTIGGRSVARAEALAQRIGARVRSGSVRDAARGRDAVLLAVTWEGVADTLRSAEAVDGALAGTTLIDCSNAVDHGVGTLRPDVAVSAAHRIADQARGASVVKAFNILPATTWTSTRDAGPRPLVPLVGDDALALDLVGRLVRDAGGAPAVLGSLGRARQVEETAGLVIGLAFAGHDPARAVPSVP